MSFEPSKVPTDARGVANTLLTRIKRVLLMDAGAAVDRILGPYARWLVAHPVLAAVPNLLLGGVFVVIGWLVIHSTYFVIVGLWESELRRCRSPLALSLHWRNVGVRNSPAPVFRSTP